MFCALLALAMAVAPVLALAGEMHELEHPIEAAADHHVSYQDGHPHPLPDGDPEGDPTGDPDGDALHVLAHASHCCAQAVAVLTATAVLQLTNQPATAVSGPPSIRHQRVAFNHFRPPITV